MRLRWLNISVFQKLLLIFLPEHIFKDSNGKKRKNCYLRKPRTSAENKIKSHKNLYEIECRWKLESLEILLSFMPLDNNGFHGTAFF